MKEINIIENKERIETLDGLNELVDIPDYAFEQVKFPDGKFYLLPIKRDYARLYRGEQKEFPSSKPTIYREGISELNFIISQIKLFEFEQMLNQHPVVKILKKQHHFFIDTHGLAQHYGFKTDLMDFSSNPLVAGFFATCHRNSKTKKYEPYNETFKQKGVIYILLTNFFSVNATTSCFPIRWGNEINPIGLQPFKRPGLQKAFSLKLSEKHDLRNYPGIFKYTFDYDSNDAQYFFNFFEQGKKVWINDDFSALANLIDNNDHYTYNSFHRAVVQLGIAKSRIKVIKTVLRSKGIMFRERIEYFPPKVYCKILEKWDNSDRDDFFKAIFKRRKFSEKNGWEECLSIDDIDEIDMLRIFQPNDKSN